MTKKLTYSLIGNETKLKIYGLFKQATEGNVKTKRPGMIDFVGRAKWDAWNANINKTQEEAQQKYIELVNSLVKAEVNSYFTFYYFYLYLNQ